VTWKIDARQGNEGYKIRWEIIQWTRGRGLDLGCGPQKTFPHFIGLDNNIDAQLFGIPANPDIRVDTCENLSLFSSKSMDFVFSSHLLEHIQPDNVTECLKEWWRVMKDGAYLVLYLPDEDEYPKVGEKGANTDHKWNVNRERVIDYMRSIKGWDLVDFQKRNKSDEYSLYFVFKKIGDGQYFSHQNPKSLKTAAVVRYGAFGDLLQSSSVIAGLKKQGYHVTLYCSPPGSDVMRHDPNIDAFYYQDKDQVPNHLLAEFWSYHKMKYDKWVNLCESVEGTFLALPGRSLHDWPPAARHRLMNVNYVEQQHLIAGVPYEPKVRFYATLPEREWARKERSKMGKKVLLWPLAGSSVHKTWPFLDQVVARIMLQYPEWDVVFVGGEACKLLEQGWESEPRVHRRSGVWSIRESMTFIDYADCLVGPETGIMNAAASLETPKVVFLSHSTEENLSRDWVNCISLWSRDTHCPGRGKNEAPACHQMHYSWDFCKKAIGPDGESAGVSQCQWDISLEQGWHAIEHAMKFQVKEAA
jgi:ADP-heptose:LPS heptosyltransferase/predicted SAM-dependent methyltransferase